MKCAYCGREAQTDKHKTCDGCGAPKLQIVFQKDKYTNAFHYSDICGFKAVKPESWSMVAL